MQTLLHRHFNNNRRGSASLSILSLLEPGTGTFDILGFPQLPAFSSFLSTLLISDIELSYESSAASRKKELQIECERIWDQRGKAELQED